MGHVIAAVILASLHGLLAAREEPLAAIVVVAVVAVVLACVMFGR